MAKRILSFGDLGATVVAILSRTGSVVGPFLFLVLSVFNFYVTKTELFMQDM